MANLPVNFDYTTFNWDDLDDILQQLSTSRIDDVDDIKKPFDEYWEKFDDWIAEADELLKEGSDFFKRKYECDFGQETETPTDAYERAMKGI